MFWWRWEPRRRRSVGSACRQGADGADTAGTASSAL